MDSNLIKEFRKIERRFEMEVEDLMKRDTSKRPPAMPLRSGVIIPPPAGLPSNDTLTPDLPPHRIPPTITRHRRTNMEIGKMALVVATLVYGAMTGIRMADIAKAMPGVSRNEIGTALKHAEARALISMIGTKRGAKYVPGARLRGKLLASV